MSDILKTVIIDLKINADEYTAKAVIAKKAITDLEASQRAMTKAGQQGSQQFVQNAQELALLRKEYNDSQNAAVNLTKVSNELTGSNQELKAGLSVLTLEYNKLSEEERINSQRGKDLGSTILTVTDKLKTNEIAVGNGRRSVGDYGKAVAGVTGLLGLVARVLGVNEEAVRALETSHHTLTAGIRDLNHITKLQSEGNVENAATTTANSEAQIENTVATEGQTAVTQEATVAQAELNATMLENPIAIVIGAVIALVGIYAILSQKTQENKEINDAFSKSIEGITKSIESTLDSITKLGIEADVISGKLSKFDGDRLKSNLETGNKIKEANEKFKEGQDKILEESESAQDGSNNKLAIIDGNYQRNRLALLEQTNDRIRTLQLAHNAQLTVLALEQVENDKKITAEAEAETAKIKADTLKKEKDDRDKANDDYLAGIAKLRKIIEDDEVAAIADDETREQAKLTLENARQLAEINSTKASDSVKWRALSDQQEAYERESESIREKYAEKRLADKIEEVTKDAAETKKKADAEEKAEAELAKAVEAIDKDLAEQQKKADDEALKRKKDWQTALQKIEKEAFQFASTLVTDITQIKDNAIQSEINGANAAKDNQVAALDQQLAAGIISQTAHDAQVASLNKQAHDKEAALKLKQFKADQDAARINVAIKTAEAIVGGFSNGPILGAVNAVIAIATGAAELAVINSQPTPAFAGGGKAISGKKVSATDGNKVRTSWGDNLLAYIKVGETVVNDDQKARLGGDAAFSRAGIPGYPRYNNGGYIIPGFADGGIADRSVALPVENRFDAQNNLLAVVRNMPNPHVAVEDIINMQDQHVRVQVNGKA